MLRKILSFSLVTLVFLSSVNAKIWRVNNNPGIVADAQNAQQAHNLSNPGDTIQFEPSPNGYGLLTISQKVILIGTGAYFNDTIPNTQYSALNPWLDQITIGTGGDSSVIMVNSKGINMTGVNNVTVQRCYLWANGLNIKNCLNFAIRGIYLDGQPLSVTSGSNGIIANSILIRTNPCSVTSVFVENSCPKVVINNNTIVAIHLDISNADFNQNIIYEVLGGGSCCCTNDAVVNLNQCSINYNVFTTGFSFQGNSQPSTTLNNKINIAPNAIFTLSGLFAAQYKLILGSAATNVGANKVTCGAYDGSFFQFKTDVQPPIPAIYKLSVPAQVGQSLNVTISTKSNN